MSAVDGQGGLRVWTTWLPPDLRMRVEEEEAQRFALVAEGLCLDAAGTDPHAVLKHLPLFNK